MSGVLDGVRVLDFGRYIAGPFCAALLGDLGADVIRIERIEGAEDRGLYPVTPGGDGGLFLQANRNKRGITLNAKAPGGAEVFRRLVASADVVTANMPTASLKDMGLDYDSLRAIRPDIIMTAISAFGATGPYAERVGFDGIGQAMSGAVWLSGPPGQPTKSFGSWVDFMAATLASHATLAAIYERSRTGKGQEVQTSLYSAALTVMNPLLIEQAITGADREPSGNRGQTAGPADTFRTRDGWIMVQVIGDGLFRRLARVIGEPGWLEDPRFASDVLRGENGEALSERMAAWAAGLTSEEALNLLEGARVPAGPVLTPRQVLADRHVREAAVMTPMSYPGAAEPIPVVIGAANPAATPAALTRSAPTLGQHTAEVLGSLGFSEDEIGALRQAGAI